MQDVDRRGWAARSGIAMLNLIAPGLGLLRVGAGQAGVAALAAPFVLFGMMAAGMAVAPITGYGHALIALAAIVASLAALYLVPIALTWRASQWRLPLRVWQRWYALAVIAIAITILMQITAIALHRIIKPFYGVSESMAPTIGRGERFIADMRWRGPIRRGDIILFRAADGVRIDRVAALGGDRIAMRDGVPIVNGIAVRRTPHGRVAVSGYDGVRLLGRTAERLPGEAGRHDVIEQGTPDFATTAEEVVPPGRIFVLGDHRDRSADSRVPAELHGVGMVPLAAIVGRPRYIYWSADRARIGTRLDR